MSGKNNEPIVADVDPVMDTGKFAREAYRLMQEEMVHLQKIGVDVAELRKRAEEWDRRHGKIDGWKFLRNVASYITGEIDKRSK